VAPAYTEADLGRIAAPTMLIAGETDPWGNLEQMRAMRRSIPCTEMLILNYAGMDPMSNHNRAGRARRRRRAGGA
jgi:pimeloyl-ACP methyl ester carboxylesterase